MNEAFPNGILAAMGCLLKVCMDVLAYRKEEIIPANKEVIPK